MEDHSKVTLIEYASCPIHENVFADHYFLKIQHYFKNFTPQWL